MPEDFLKRYMHTVFNLITAEFNPLLQNFDLHYKNCNLKLQNRPFCDPYLCKLSQTSARVFSFCTASVNCQKHSLPQVSMTMSNITKTTSMFNQDHFLDSREVKSVLPSFLS